jgi:hypothetical protein
MALPFVYVPGDGVKFIPLLLLISVAVTAGYFLKPSSLRILKLSLWCYLFMLLGYFMYFTALIRSNANPGIDMNNVDNPISLVYYLSREQYGSAPLIYGPHFAADPSKDLVQDEPFVESEMKYIKGKDSYIPIGRTRDYNYNSDVKQLFPRVWDSSDDQYHAQFYSEWLGLGQDPQSGAYEAPSYGDNINWFFSYQMSLMYWRYFMWNFAGKQNDIQGTSMGNPRDGNWKTGIGFYDNMRLGDQKTLPDSLKNNKADNRLFMLPFILGILGIIYQFKKDRKDALVTGLLFFFTGIAICLYLNQAGNQPRERDYAYVGSFYAFAIWIGLGVLYIRDLLMAPLKNAMTATALATALCLLAVPGIMAKEEWDDHDRSQKTMARDLAKNYLESCAPNAILICFGDNDTYPLWYAQEVEGIRRDVRVINSSLLGTDWYINQLRYKLNDSDPIDAIWSAAQIEGSTRDVIRYAPNTSGVDPNQFMDLYTMMKDYAGSDDPAKGAVMNGDDMIHSFPSQNVMIPVDSNMVRQNGTINADDKPLDAIRFKIERNYIYKNDAAILNIIAANKWKRPIYFTSPYGELGFERYLRQDGMTYRLVPLDNGGRMSVNVPWVMDKMLNKFAFGNAQRGGVFYDEENRRHLNSIRLAYAQAAGSMAEMGKTEEAKKLLSYCDSNLSNANHPYGLVSRFQQHNQISMQMLYAAYRANDPTLIEKIKSALRKDMEQQNAYYDALPDKWRENLANEIDRNNNLLGGIGQMEQQFNMMKAMQQPQPVSNQATTDTAKP